MRKKERARNARLTDFGEYLHDTFSSLGTSLKEQQPTLLGVCLSFLRRNSPLGGIILLRRSSFSSFFVGGGGGSCCVVILIIFVFVVVGGGSSGGVGGSSGGISGSFLNEI